ncbi:MAG: class IV adenylate cyclase [Thermofilum sp.]|jgi:adenylate cyclase class 2|uniref:class IV adenylate cyclase n=1 Tax=Thermofilum sp. TaxID=1961369 RepID=UPI0025892DE2|nr:class IV adenylate cyclase [Thermofilum sp.]MCI4408613.1 class IV adenylate cyclase [Thermofilum sp.]
MHREVEVKFSISEPSRIREKLLELGATYVDTVDQVDIYYQHPCKNFAETDEALRLRENNSKSGKSIELTYKGPKSGGWAKDRVEIVSRVIDSVEMQEILEMLGFKTVARLQKHREFYMIRGVEVSIDKVEGLGDFVEIEDKGGGLEAIREIASLLGLGEPVPKTYLELYLEKFRK